MPETRIFFRQGQSAKPSPLLLQLKERAAKATDGKAVEDRGDHVLHCNHSGFCAIYTERMVRVPMAIERMDVRITKATIVQEGLPLNPLFSPFLGFYHGDGDFSGSWANVDMYIGKETGMHEVLIDMTVKPNKADHDELSLNDFYTAIRSRQVLPTRWYQPVPAEYRLQ